MAVPDYHYQCSACQQQQVIHHSMQEKPTVVCEDCGHFCQRVYNQKFTIANSAEAPCENKATDSQHACGPGCIHHYSQF